MSIRIDQKLFNRFDKALDRERRKDPAVTQRSLVEQSLRMYLDEHHPTRQQQREAGSNGRNDSAATGAAAS